MKKNGVKAVKKEKKKDIAGGRGREKVRERKFGLNLKIQLIAGFLVPIVFVVIVGQYAYQKAADALIDNYEEAATVSMNMTASLLDMGFSAVEAESMQLYNDEAVLNFLKNTYKNEPADNVKNRKNVQLTMATFATADKFLTDIHIISEGDLTNLTVSQGTNENYTAKQWKEQYAVDNSSRAVWISEHSNYDDQASASITSNVKINTSKYICSVFRKSSSGNGYVVMDVSAERVQEILSDLDLGESSVVSFVTEQGRELSEQTNITLADKAYYQEFATGEKIADSTYVTENGIDYLFMYARCEVNGAAVCALVPKSEIMAEAQSMRNMVYLLILLAVAVVLLIGVLILFGISRNMSHIIKKLSRVSQGDLTVQMKTTNKTEFGRLAAHVMDSVANMKQLIEETVHVSEEVKDAVEQVNRISQDLLDVSEGIQSATGEIDKGLNQQAQDAEGCLHKMDSLSQLIEETHERMNAMGAAAKTTEQEIETGVRAMEDVTQQADTIGRDSDALSTKIQELEEASEEIQNFVSTIKDIAEETNLLSLNASIEAARAGEAGRGFAVVAQEIKKLADSSILASEEITKIVERILNMTQDTVRTSKLTERSIADQKVVVVRTSSSFDSMTRSVERLTENLDKVNDQMGMMQNDRNDTLSSIESISSVMEETAASSTVVKEAVDDQLDRVNQLIEIAGKLDMLTRKMQEAISSFQI